MKMPNGRTPGQPNLRGPKAVIIGAFLAFCMYLFWVLDKEAGWGLWPF